MAGKAKGDIVADCPLFVPELGATACKTVLRTRCELASFHAPNRTVLSRVTPYIWLRTRRSGVRISQGAPSHLIPPHKVPRPLDSLKRTGNIMRYSFANLFDRRGPWNNLLYDTAQPPRSPRAAKNRATAHRTVKKETHFRQTGAYRLRPVCNRNGAFARVFLDLGILQESSLQSHLAAKFATSSKKSF